MTRMATIIFAISGLLMLDTSIAKDLYVDQASGDDSVSYAVNSASNPWRTLGRALWGNANHSSPNASQAAAAGDVVHVAAGTYNTNAVTDARYVPLYNPVNSGTAGSPITIRAEGDVYLISTNSPGAQPIVGTLERSYIVWDGFIIDEAQVPTRPDTGPVVVWNSNHVTIQNMHVIGTSRPWGDNHNGIRIEGSDNVTIRNNRVRGFTESHGGAVTTYRTSNLLVEHNHLSDANDGVFIKGANPGPVTIRYNLVENTHNGIMLGQIGLAGEMSYVYQNVIRNSSLGGVVFVGYDGQTPAHVTVSNNTIDVASPSADGGGILLRPEYSGYRNIIIRNNIVTRSAGGMTAWGTDLDDISLDYNNYYNNDRDLWLGYGDFTLAQWQADSGEDIHSTADNPQFVGSGDYRLSDSSPVHQAGLDLLDLDGDGSRLDTIAMGAYITGDEVIGLTSAIDSEPLPEPTPDVAPSPPSGIEITQ